MPPIYVIQQGAKIRINNRRLQVELVEDEQTSTLAQAPLGQVSQVVIFGNIGLTTPAIDALLLQGVEVVFLTQDGDYRGSMTGGMTPHVPLRRAQYRSLDLPAFVLETARDFVRAKLQHQRALLQRHNKDKDDPEVADAINQLNRTLGELEHKTALSSLRGLEGASTAAYFSGLRRLFDPAWHFTSRQRRPPPDPVNVLLSLGYTLMGQITASAAQTVGLDPYAGYLHEVVYNRPALGLDLLEEFRPVVDGVALWCCRSGQLTPQDFTPGPPERPVLLGEKGKRCFLQAFEQRLDTRFTHPLSGLQLPLRQCVVEQARQLARLIMEGKTSFRGMGFR